MGADNNQQFPSKPTRRFASSTASIANVGYGGSFIDTELLTLRLAADISRQMIYPNNRQFSQSLTG
jgi:hypothetical protein